MTLLEIIRQAAVELGVDPSQVADAYEAAMRDSMEVAVTMKREIPQEVERLFIDQHKKLLIALAHRTDAEADADERRLLTDLRAHAKSN